MPHILIIGSDRLIRWSLHENFNAIGWNVEEADSKKTAESRLEEAAYDLIIMDLEMRDSGGPDFIREIMNRLPRTRIIILTTGAPEEIRSRVPQQAEIVGKPFEESEIIGVAKSVLAGKNN